MKRFLTLLLPLVMIVSACGEKSTVPYVFPDPPFAGKAVRYVCANLGAPIVSLSFTEGGTYLLCSREAEPVADGPDKSYIAGRYAVDVDGVYLLDGYGTVKVGGTKADTAELTFSPTVGDPVVIRCIVQTGGEGGSLYRQWSVTTSRVKLSGNISVAADFTGCDINEICGFLEENGLISHNTFPAGQKVSLVDISTLGEITVLYENGNVDHATISSYTATAIGYQWASPGMGYGFETGTATFEFDEDCCIFTILGRFTGNGKKVDMALIWALQENK